MIVVVENGQDNIRRQLRAGDGRRGHLEGPNQVQAQSRYLVIAQNVCHPYVEALLEILRHYGGYTRRRVSWPTRRYGPIRQWLLGVLLDENSQVIGGLAAGQVYDRAGG